MAKRKASHELDEDERTAKDAQAAHFVVEHDVVGSGASVDRNNPTLKGPQWVKGDVISAQDLKSSQVDVERLLRVGAIRPAEHGEAED